MRSRPADALYDPLFAVSSKGDHVRAVGEALHDTAKTAVVANFSHMFARSPSCARRCVLRLPVPLTSALVDAAAYVANPSAPFPIPSVDPAAGAVFTTTPHAVVTGGDRYKFFRVPLRLDTRPAGDEPPGAFFTDTRESSSKGRAYGQGDSARHQQAGVDFFARLPGGDRKSRLRSVSGAARRAQHGSSRSGSAVAPFLVDASVQTIMRDSEAQTLPHTPEYTIARTVAMSSAAPPSLEILALASLCYGAGLPAGLREVEMIERARAKRVWESQLPPAENGVPSQKSTAAAAKRMQMMQEMELREWADREREIERLQARRLAVVAHLLETRVRAAEDSSNVRLLNAYNAMMARRAHERAKLAARRTKLMRNLLSRHVRSTRAAGIAPSALPASASQLYTARADSPSLLDENASALSAAASNKPAKSPGSSQGKGLALAAAAPAASLGWSSMGVTKRRDIITEYANAASRTLFPRPRDGAAPQLQSLKCADKKLLGITARGVDIRFLDTLLCSVSTNTAPPDFSEALQRRSSHYTGVVSASGVSLSSKSYTLQQEFASGRPGKQAAALGPPRYLVPLPKPVVRPPTPSIVRNPEEDCENGLLLEEAEYRMQLALVVQRYVRGRLEQKEIIAGLERRRALIEELRLENSFQSALESAKNEIAAEPNRAASALKALQLQPNEVGEAAETQMVEPGTAAVQTDLTSEDALAQETDYVKHIQPTFVGHYLDHLDKAIQRLRDERRISALSKLAERTRQMREAQETGRRVAELTKRSNEDSMFQKIMNLHHEAVDTYLERIVAEATDEAATARARASVKAQCEAVMRAVDAPHPLGFDEGAGTEDGSLNSSLDEGLYNSAERSLAGRQRRHADAAVVRSLVSGFLIPEVERRVLRSEVESEQSKLLVAVHDALYSRLPVVDQNFVAFAKDQRKSLDNKSLENQEN